MSPLFLTGAAEVSSIVDTVWIPILVAVLGAVLGAIAVDIWVHIKKKSKKALDKKEASRKAELKELFDEFSAPIITKLDSAESKLDKVADGSKNSLRNDILKYYYDCLKKEYRTEKDTQNFEAMFNSYIALGGNSFIKNEISPAFHEIPFKTEKEVYEIEYNKKIERESRNKKLDLVIERSMSCPVLEGKFKTQSKRVRTSKKTNTSSDK